MQGMSLNIHCMCLLEKVDLLFAFDPLLPTKMSSFSHQHPHPSNACSCYLPFNTSNTLPEASAAQDKAFEKRTSPDIARVILSTGKTQLDQYTSMVVDLDTTNAELEGPLEKKKKNRDDVDCLSSDQNKELKDSKKSNGRRQKKPTKGSKTKPDEKREQTNPPTGYIHVRARRGQATDSHSLAERVRREKISQRMKFLQGLVPGCDKITGKALMLDEIINYVWTLQHQVEFLSMKLAFMNSTLHDSDEELMSGALVDDQQLEKWSLSQASVSVKPVLQASPIQQAAFDEAITGSSHPTMDNSSHLLLHGQGPIALPHDQDNGSTYDVLMQCLAGADQREDLLSQVDVPNTNSNFSFE